MMTLKKESSKWIKTKGIAFSRFHWQDGYGAFSIGEFQVVAVTGYIRGQKERHKTLSFEDELVAVIWPGHAFASRPYVVAGDFSTETYLTYSLVRQPGFEADRLWEAGNTLPLRERNVGSIEAVCELVRAKVGVSVLSRWGAHRHFASGGLVPVRTA